MIIVGIGQDYCERTLLYGNPNLVTSLPFCQAANNYTRTPTHSQIYHKWEWKVHVWLSENLGKTGTPLKSQCSKLSMEITTQLVKPLGECTSNGLDRREYEQLKLVLFQNIIYYLIMLWLVRYWSKITEKLPEIGEKGSLFPYFGQESSNFEPVFNES